MRTNIDALFVECDDMDIYNFKKSWPCSGFPDNLFSIEFYFDEVFDLIDIDGYDKNGHFIDIADFDGAALFALCDDAKEFLKENIRKYRGKF